MSICVDLYKVLRIMVVLSAICYWGEGLGVSEILGAVAWAFSWAGFGGFRGCVDVLFSTSSTEY